MFAVLAAIGLSACAVQPEVVAGNYAPMSPIPMPEASAASGAIYSVGRQYSLFDDVRARNVGDVLTVRLVEQTQASKSASTDTSRSTDVETGSPTIFGQNGAPLFDNSIASSQAFAGAATSSQSNQLTGDITVTVAQVLANGNLVVRGEKWLTLNQGEEYIQISGIVRPDDVAPDNSVASVRLADARIAYSGKGQVANTSRPGWLNRFFTSIIWPL
jgi:flagellar L-ring protein precursor FlgH